MASGVQLPCQSMERVSSLKLLPSRTWRTLWPVHSGAHVVSITFQELLIPAFCARALVLRPSRISMRVLAARKGGMIAVARLRPPADGNFFPCSLLMNLRCPPSLPGDGIGRGFDPVSRNGYRGVSVVAMGVKRACGSLADLRAIGSSKRFVRGARTAI